MDGDEIAQEGEKREIVTALEAIYKIEKIQFNKQACLIMQKTILCFQ